MIYLDFISDFNNLIFNDFYNLTDGKIILAGSSVLKYHKILDRKAGNLNLALDINDIEYFDKLNNNYNFNFIGEQSFGLINKTYWFECKGIYGALFLQNSVEFDIFTFNNYDVRIQTISNIRYNKMKLIENNDSKSIKHYADVEMIDKFYGNIIQKNII